MKTIFFLLGLIAFASATVFFSENFEDGWEDRWVYSTADEEEGTGGTFAHTAGKWYHDESDKGIQTSTDARFYKMSAVFPTFENKDTLVLQYSVKNEQKIDCGGGYIKLMKPGFDPKTLTGETEYTVMFGPDVCGTNKRVHYILNYNDENHLIKKTVNPEEDQLTHFYTAVLKSDQTYEIYVDGEKKESGAVVEDWDVLPPKQINDPNESKPEDWVDEAQIVDPEAVKPEGWDDVLAEIPDPDATKPEDWDDELDGEWEPPLIDNPEYQGEWEAPMIDNPEYKGEWEHPQIDNPEYVYDDSIYKNEHGGVSFEIWQVKTGTIFDNILVTDSLDDALAAVSSFTADKAAAEQKMFEDLEAEREAAEEAERQAEMEDLEVDEDAEDQEDEGDEDVEESAGHKDEL